MEDREYDNPSITPPTGLTRIKRLSKHDLMLDIQAAHSFRQRRHSESVRYDATCPFASPECKTVADREIGNGDGDSMCKCDTEVEVEGQQLFMNFVKEEIVNSGLEEKASVLTPWVVQTPFGYQNPQWAKAGKELRHLADAFSKTKERQKVKKKACNMNVLEMSYHQFRDLLSELFMDHGITSERIVVLFFFCSDLALTNLIHDCADMFQQCITWTWKFISEKICTWVKEHGGWRVVLSDSVEYIGPKIVGAFVVVAAAATLYNYLKR